MPSFPPKLRRTIRPSCFVLILALACGKPLAPGASAADGPAIEDEIVVTGSTPSERQSSEPVNVMRGEHLRRRLQSTLGATLEEELGVHNASFGPGVGIPVVRGLTGVRLRVLQDGLGTHDASAASPDHAVTIEPLLAEEIRVVRSADVIRYGGSALGGSVQVKDNQIPERLPEAPLTGAVEARYGFNPNGHAEVFKLDVGTGFLAGHIEGFLRESALVDIPGAALDEAAVRAEFGDAVAFENAFGTLPNSDAESRGGAVGASLVGDAGFLGLALSTLDNEYGIPPGGLPPHSDIPGQLPPVQRIRIDIAQGRKTLKGALLDPLPGIERALVQAAHVKYRHHEQDGRFVSTTFRNEATETRAEIEHRAAAAWPGVLGVHWIDRNFSALGFETFVPSSAIKTLGVFATQAHEGIAHTLTVGARRETTSLRPRDTTRVIGGMTPVPLPRELEFTAWSASAALEFTLPYDVVIRLAYDHAQRPPDVQELLALGPHLSTRSFDIGRPDLELERAHLFDVGLRWQLPLFTLAIDGYTRRVNDYIYLENQDLVFDIEDALFRVECVQVDRCVGVFGYAQQDARFHGFEANLAVPIAFAFGTLTASAFSDYVRGYFAADGAGDVPRLPPRSYGMALDLDAGRWHGGLRLTRAAAQRRPGTNEAPSDAYLMLNADFGLRLPRTFGVDAQAFVRGRNLLDREVRNATSFLRSFMPEPGRSVELVLWLEH